MKVLIGVCGIGKGHSTRQLELSRELIRRGHEVRIITFSEGLNIFKNNGFLTYEVFVPFIKFKGTKFDYIDIFKRNYKHYIKGKILNRRVFEGLKKENFIPDICVSDYEPTIAKFAYKYNIPLINIDQQSKFIYMSEDYINGYSLIEEKKRLNYFFPKFNYKYIISFYKIDNKLPSNVEMVPPIIKKDIKVNNRKVKNNSVVVYFSKYGNISIEQSLNDILNIFAVFTEYNFIVYTDFGQKLSNISRNIIIKKINEKEFARDLGKCCSVITTAGHTLISECYYCKIPVYVIPLPTFDQHYCGKFVRENNLGFSTYTITVENLKDFFSKLNFYTSNIESNCNLLKSIDTVKYLVDELENYNLKK